MKPVDAHCHLDFDRFDEDRDKVVKRCKENLEFVVNAGSNMANNRKALELREKYGEFIVPNLGLHPTYTDHFHELDEVKELVKTEDPVAVGEIGLDHHHVTDEELRDEQEKVFRELLELAEELGKPVVVHSREAEQEAFEIVSEYDLPDVMFHCFNGKPELAEKAVGEGITIGITTQVLYSSRVQNIVEAISTEDMLLETDSPFLYRGERNEPVNVKESAEKIAEMKGVSKEKVIEDTTGNARRIFQN